MPVWKTWNMNSKSTGKRLLNIKAVLLLSSIKLKKKQVKQEKNFNIKMYVDKNCILSGVKEQLNMIPKLDWIDLISKTAMATITVIIAESQVTLLEIVQSQE